MRPPPRPPPSPSSPPSPHAPPHTLSSSRYVGLRQVARQAGCTPLERLSFSRFLQDGHLVDTFRWLHPAAQGCFSYWSQRHRNRDANYGLRLDYVVASQSMCVDVGAVSDGDGDGNGDGNDSGNEDGSRAGGDAGGGAGGGGDHGGDGHGGDGQGQRGATIEDSFILDDATLFPPYSDHSPVGCVVRLPDVLPEQ